VPATAAGASATITITLHPTAVKSTSGTWQLKLGDGRATSVEILGDDPLVRMVRLR